MGSYRLSKAAQGLVTCLVMLAVVITTFAPGWMPAAQAAPVAPDETGGSSERSAAQNPGASVLGPPGAALTSLAPMNALVLGEPGSIDTLTATITNAGGYVYVRQGNALFVGLEELGYNELAPVGARAVYRGTVSPDDLAVLPAGDRDVIQTWNQVVRGEVASIYDMAGWDSAGDTIALKTPNEPAPDSTRADYEPNNQQTSVFMVGSVSVDVVFVESVGDAQNWTAAEISKVKAEVVSAFDWWTVAATAPLPSGGDQNPQAQLTWNVNYHSPLEGTTAERAKVKIPQEPIQGSIQSAYQGWIPNLAATFTGMPASDAAVRAWAHNTRTDGETDWGFVLFVVDSSDDADHRFDGDGKVAGAALAGPWAVVTYDAGDLGVSSLEVIIAKMTGHVFGAGDETYTPEMEPGGCRNDERYGYFRIAHDNCEYDNPFSDTSLMRSGTEMVGAYREHMLSESARQQVGWLNSDDDDLYDVMDTLEDNFPEYTTDPVCPVLHLADVDVTNTPARPSDYGPGGTENEWVTEIWDPNTETMSTALTYSPVNINRVGYVWGRVNEGDWIAGSPADGVAWDSEDEGYNIQLPGIPGEINEIEIAIMNRWEQEGYRPTDPYMVSIQAVPGFDPAHPDYGTAQAYQAEDTDYVELFFANGAPGGWFDATDGYLGGVTKTTVSPGNEACFGFEGTEVTIVHSTFPDWGTADVYVDGDLHSTIDYDDAQATEAKYVIGNLPDGKHAVSLVMAGGTTIDFDAFKITDGSLDATKIIDATNVADIPADADGFYEDTGVKIQYVGQWNTNDSFTLNDNRQGTPDDFAHGSSRELERIYAHFTNADTAAVYRRVALGAGTADVFLNGEYWGTMNNEADTPQVTPYYISGLSPAITYTLEIRINEGTPYLVFDALRLLNIDTDPSLYAVSAGAPDPLDVPYDGDQERYGDWEDPGTFLRAFEEGTVANVYFKGSAIAVRRSISRNHGVMQLYVDGKLMKTVNNYAWEPFTDMPVYVHGMSPNFPHVLQVRLVDINDLGRTHRIDGYTVYYFEPVTEGEYEEYEYDNGNPTQSVFLYENDWDPPVTNATASGGHFIRTALNDDVPNSAARAYLYFTEVDTITLYGIANPAMGAADIYVNNELKGTFILNHSQAQYDQPFTITDLPKLSVNVLEIRVNTSIAGLPSRISLDRVVLYNRSVLGPGTYENDAQTPLAGGGFAPKLQFSGHWKRVQSALSHDSGTIDIVTSADDTLSFSVHDATSIMLYRPLRPISGKADVYVNGEYHSSFNSYSDTSVWQVPYVISNLDKDLTNDILIKPRVSGSSFGKFDIDYLEVRGNEVSGVSYLANMYYENDDVDALNGGAITYSGTSWVESHDTPTNPDSDTQSYTNHADDQALVIFYGNAFTVFFNRSPNGGLVDVFIDGVLQKRVNTNSDSVLWHVPFSAAGLEEGMHTAEIVAKTGYTKIDGYRAYTVAPESPLDYDLISGDPKEIHGSVILSGYWFIAGDYLRTREEDASIFIYTTNGDTLYTTRRVADNEGNIDFYVNGELKNTAAGGYLKYLETPNEEFVLSSLTNMMDDDCWIELRAKPNPMVTLQRIRIGILNPIVGFQAEAEGDQVYTAGYWTQRPESGIPSVNYSGGFYTLSHNGTSRFYFAVNDTDYVILYRPLHSTFRTANVYVDGEFWGIMDNYSPTIEFSVPFAIGPFPAGRHVVELRERFSTQHFGIDEIRLNVGDTLTPGLYENNDAMLVGGYTGDWIEVAHAASSGNTVHQTNTKGDRLSLTFYGNMITIYRRLWPIGGFMSVFIDGKRYPISTDFDTGAHRVPHTILLPDSGFHTFDLVLNSGMVELDAIEIGNAIPATFGAYQESSPKVVINDPDYMWPLQENENVFSDGARVKTNVKYASIFFLFEGRRVTTYMQKGPAWGKVRILLDGQSVEEINLYSASNEVFYAYDITGLQNTTHVVELRFEYRKGQGKYNANLDVFSVDGAPIPRPNEHIPPPEPDTGGEPGPSDVPTYGCYEESNEWMLIGPWLPATSEGASMDLYAYVTTGDPNEVYAEFDFQAEGFSLLYHKNYFGGVADIYLDDMETPYDTLSMYDADHELWLSQAKYDVTGLDDSVVHLLRVVFTGAAGGGGYTRIYIDRVDLPVYDSQWNDNCYATPD